MRIGVLATVQHSMFSSGIANMSLAVAELMRELGHEVELVNILTEQREWWDDCQGLAAGWKVVGAATASGYDILFEIGRMTLTAELRAKIARNVIWIVRQPFLIGELEASLFPTTVTPRREMEGLTETWILDAAAAAEPGSVQILELLTRRPVRVVPYLWTSSIAETHLKEMGLKPWLHATVTELQRLQRQAREPDAPLAMPPWNVHVAETNTCNSSSAVLPLVILREARRRGLPIERFRVHNGDLLMKSKFFLENTLKHCADGEVGLSGDFVGRQRCVEWVREPMSLVLSHIRFSTLRPMLLDLAWAGVPLVHNSPALRELGCGLERGYYPDNRVGEACDAVQRMTADLAKLEGLFAPDSYPSIRAMMTARWTPAGKGVQEGWGKALEALGVLGAAAGVATPKEVATKPVEMSVSTVPVAAAPSAAAHSKLLRVGFADMWADFNPTYNFFTLLLADAGSRMTPPVEVVGEAATAASDVVFFGPFGESWKALPPEQPKIHFTGENTAPVRGPGVKLNLGFQHLDMVDEGYLRFPLWILEIDWFGADAARIQNPKPIPLERCTKVVAAEVGQRHKKFCAFVVSNPSNPVRNAAFHWLSSYKPVDSAGRLFNNIGDAIFAGPGGGGGELAKLEFFKDYKFALTYENNSARGYTTEKYLHAKAAGCVPIYWGDPAFERDFSTAGCIDARSVRTPEELIALVRAVDEDDGEYLKRVAVPALDAYKVAWCQRTMAELARRVFGLGGLDTNSAAVVVGERPVTAAPVAAPAVASPTASQNPARGPTPTASQTPLELPVLVTYSNRRFLPSLKHWLTAVGTQWQAVPQLRAIVWLDPDVPEDSRKALEESYDAFAEFRLRPTEVPDGAFPDFWAPEHYAWKLWILRRMAEEKELAGRMVLYMDAGSFLCRWPKEWLTAAQESDICLLEDGREENRRWCSAEFCRALGVTEAELAGQQVQAATIAFRAGSEKAVALFGAAMEAALRREVIAGAKWAGQGEDGRPFGHRHDQSVLSILSARAGIRRWPLDQVQCGDSLRKTFTTRRAIYMHRGAFTVHRQFLEGIDEAYVINLDRRADRMERLLGTHPELQGRVERWSAVEGKALRLTPALARLLRPNDFFWKKAVAGCALSHLGLWWKLAHENPDIKNYLILEDDVKFQRGWEGQWARAIEEGHIPDDYDILYLGGVLPPNRGGWAAAGRERVNASFVRVAENMMWGQGKPNRYFHFCAYAYVLSRRGAEKVLGLLESQGGYWTSADHILCNPVDVLKSYVLDPAEGLGSAIGAGALPAGCYQDDDPKYAGAVFNDFSRIDSFDSDLWNNDERFSVEEVAAVMLADDTPLEIGRALMDAREVGAPTAAAPAPEVSRTIGTGAGAPTREEAGEELRKELTSPAAPRAVVGSLPRRLVCLAEHALDLSQLHEYEWLMELLGNPTTCVVERVRPTDPPPTDEPVLVVQRPHLEALTAMMERWNDAGAKFHVLHLSDEYSVGVGDDRRLYDDVSFYGLEGCRSVLRFYVRPDLPAEVARKVTVIPLGYHWTRRDTSQDSLVKTPKLPFRENAWSFFGTEWMGRQKQLEPLKAVGPYDARFFRGWNDTGSLKREEYISALLNSVFVPCPDGMNPETYRFYEALECGCVPLLVRTERNGPWVEWVTEHLPLLVLGSWEETAGVVQHLMAEKGKLEVYRERILRAWSAWRGELKKEVAEWLLG